MTTPMPDLDLADLRNMLERSTEFVDKIRCEHVDQQRRIRIQLGTIDIDDVRALVARLDQERAKAIEECAQVVVRANMPYMFNAENSVAESLRRTALLDALVVRIRAIDEVKP